MLNCHKNWDLFLKASLYVSKIELIIYSNAWLTHTYCFKHLKHACIRGVHGRKRKRGIENLVCVPVQGQRERERHTDGVGLSCESLYQDKKLPSFEEAAGFI